MLSHRLLRFARQSDLTDRGPSQWAAEHALRDWTCGDANGQVERFLLAVRKLVGLVDAADDLPRLGVFGEGRARGHEIIEDQATDGLGVLVGPRVIVEDPAPKLLVVGNVAAHPCNEFFRGERHAEDCSTHTQLAQSLPMP